jgi:hypothetical protein
MNEDLETSLREVPVSAVPDSLDETVEATIRRFEANGPRRIHRRVPLWAAALACAVCTVLGFTTYPLLRSTQTPRPAEPSVIYIENLPGELPDVLGGGNSEGQAGFFEHKHSEVRDINQG